MPQVVEEERAGEGRRGQERAGEGRRGEERAGEGRRGQDEGKDGNVLGKLVHSFKSAGQTKSKRPLFLHRSVDLTLRPLMDTSV